MCVYVFVCVCVQAARGPAACGRVLPGSDVPDEDSVHGLLLQPPLRRQRPHTAQVAYQPRVCVRVRVRVCK